MDGMDWNSLGEGQVSGLSSDAQDAELRADLAAALRRSAVEISARLERCYVEQYPHSRANQMDAAAIHEWTLSDIETLACAIEADDPSLRYFGTMVGDQLVDLHNAELTPFVNFLSTIHFEARVIAPVLYASLLGTPARASRLVECFERFIQKIIVWNCFRYAEQISQPRALARSWNLMGAVEPAAPIDDTPAKRYLGRSEEANAATMTLAQPPFEALSPREEEVLRLVVEGKTNGEIAQALSIRQNTVKNHVAHIFDKFNVNTRAELIARVLRG